MEDNIKNVLDHVLFSDNDKKKIVEYEATLDMFNKLVVAGLAKRRESKLSKISSEINYKYGF